MLGEWEAMARQLAQNERERTRLELELSRLTTRRKALLETLDRMLAESEQARAALAGEPVDANTLANLGPYAGAPDDPPVAGLDHWRNERREVGGQETRALRWNTGGMSALSQPVPCPDGCDIRDVHRHFADGQVAGYR